MSKILRIGRSGTKLATTWQGEFGTQRKLLMQERDVTLQCPPESRDVVGEVYLTCDEETSQCSGNHEPCADDLGCPPGETCEGAITLGSTGFAYSHADCGGVFRFTNTGGAGMVDFFIGISLKACGNPPIGGSDEPEEGDFIRANIGMFLVKEGSGEPVSVPIVSTSGFFSPEDQNANPAFNTINGQAVVKQGDSLPEVSGGASGRLAFTDRTQPGGQYWLVGCRYQFRWFVSLASFKADSSPGNYALQGVNNAPQRFAFSVGPGCLRPTQKCELP